MCALYSKLAVALYSVWCSIPNEASLLGPSPSISSKLEAHVDAIKTSTCKRQPFFPYKRSICFSRRQRIAQPPPPIKSDEDKDKGSQRFPRPLGMSAFTCALTRSVPNFREVYLILKLLSLVALRQMLCARSAVMMPPCKLFVQSFVKRDPAESSLEFSMLFNSSL